MLFYSRVPEKRFSFSVQNQNFVKNKNANDGIDLEVQIIPHLSVKNVSVKTVLTESQLTLNEKIFNSFSKEKNNVISLQAFPKEFPFETKIYVKGTFENGVTFEDSFAFFTGYLPSGELGVVDAPIVAFSYAVQNVAFTPQQEKEPIEISVDDHSQENKGGFDIVFDWGFLNPWGGALEKCHSFKWVIFNKGSVVSEKIIEMEDDQRLFIKSETLDLRDIVMHFKTENNTTWIDPMKTVAVDMSKFYVPGQTDYGCFYPSGGDEWNRAYFAIDRLYQYRKMVGNSTGSWMPKFKTKYPSTDVKDNMAQWSGFWKEMVLGKVFHSYWVVAHEFGHGIMDSALGAMPGMYTVIPIHDVDTIDDKGGSHAWVEGFAEFMQVFLTGGNTVDCRPALFGKWYNDNAGHEVPTDIETPEAPSRKWLNGFYDTGTAGYNDKGWMVEGVIAAFLWDLQDNNADSDDTESGLFNNIVAVIKDKKPKNMMEFIYGWGDKYGFSDGFGKLYWHHLIGGPSVKLEDVKEWELV